MNIFVSVSAFALATVQLIFLANFFVSIFAGKRVLENNPWHATTLEWETPCPTGHGNFGDELPVVHRWAFDYSVPGAKNDFVPQTVPPGAENLISFMPVLTEDKVSGGIGVPPRWNGPSGGDGREGPDSSFPVSTRQMATWLLMTGIAMLFAGLTSAYIVLRGVPTWESIQLPPLVWGNTLVLLASSVTLELARRAVKDDSSSLLRLWLGITAIFGISFLAGQILLWRQMTTSGLLLASTLHSSFFYVLSSIHAVHILGGLIGLALVSIKAWSGRLSSTSFEPLRLCATYWHFIGGVWLYLILLLVFA